MSPSISVIMSVYNGERYIAKAVESVLNQTLSDFEFIIIDDGSTDTTSEIIASFTDSRIVRIHNRENIGLVASLNIGIRASIGEYLVRADADDVCHPERFARQFAFMEQHQDVGVLGTWMEQVDENLQPLHIYKFPLSHNVIRWKMLFETAMFHPTVIMRRNVVESAGGYDENFKHIEDTELWSRLVKLTRFSNLGEVLYKRTWHPASVCNVHYQEQFRIGATLRKRMFEDILERDVDVRLITCYSDFLNVGAKLTVFNKARVVILLLTTAQKFMRLIDEPMDCLELLADIGGRICQLYKGNVFLRIVFGLKHRLSPAN